MITGHKDIIEARRFIFETMVKVSKGEISIDKALAIHKLGSDLMEGYRLQLRALEVAQGSSVEPISLCEATRQLER